MKKTLAALALVAAFSCTKVPLTGRKQLNLLPESELMSMSLTSYHDFLAQHPPASDIDAETQMVRRVGAKISHAVENFLRSEHKSDRIRNFNWEYNLVKDPTVNAWCMPGGKVVVYSGLLGVTLNETALAAVMGHEVAHAVARHGNERMSQQLIMQAGGLGLSVALDKKPELTKNIFLTSYGVASTLGVLAYSRTHETEADKMGLVFMAMAGYDPNESIAFWERMSKSGGPNPPELLSTHPSDETRIKDLKEFLPKALKYYNKAITTK